MHDVYSNAYLAIAANHAKNPSEGYFNIRSPCPSCDVHLPGYAKNIHIELLFVTDERTGTMASSYQNLSPKGDGPSRSVFYHNAYCTIIPGRYTTSASTDSVGKMAAVKHGCFIRLMYCLGQKITRQAKITTKSQNSTTRTTRMRCCVYGIRLFGCTGDAPSPNPQTGFQLPAVSTSCFKSTSAVSTLRCSGVTP